MRKIILAAAAAGTLAAPAIAQPSGNAGRTGDPVRLLFPRAHGCTFCGHCVQGCVVQ